MEVMVFALFGWCLFLTIRSIWTNEDREMDIEFLKDDVRRLRDALGRATNRHRKLKDALREAVTDDE